MYMGFNSPVPLVFTLKFHLSKKKCMLFVSKLMLVEQTAICSIHVPISVIESGKAKCHNFCNVHASFATPKLPPEGRVTKAVFSTPFHLNALLTFCMYGSEKYPKGFVPYSCFCNIVHVYCCKASVYFFCQPRCCWCNNVRLTYYGLSLHPCLSITNQI